MDGRYRRLGTIPAPVSAAVAKLAGLSRFLEHAELLRRMGVGWQ